MERKEFIKKGLSSLGLLTVSPIIASCQKLGIGADTQTSTTGSTNGSSASDCAVTKSETAGPFPTKNPASFVIKDITSDRKGVSMLATITIKNKNTSCAALQGAMVDFWHCDADGNYSEYGGFTSAHFLRGRQTTDANGNVAFQTIFPGWYSGRTTHIHVHIFNAAGKSLLVTQIAFPPAVCDTVFTTATSFYKNGKQNTSNERDGIFSDGYANELCTIEGSVNAGYKLSHTIVVNA